MQRRGVERVHAILDAAEEILTDEGYEAATLRAIGERAGIPTASVYHYFPDRYEVDTQLMVRHIEAMDAAVQASLANRTALTSLTAAVGAVVDPMLAYFREHPSSIELWYGGRSPGQSDAVQAYDAVTADMMLALAIERGLLRPDTPPMVMRLAFEVGTCLFDAAFRVSPRYGDEATLDEARRLITLYLESYAPTHASDRRLA